MLLKTASGRKVLSSCVIDHAWKIETTVSSNDVMDLSNLGLVLVLQPATAEFRPLVVFSITIRP